MSAAVLTSQASPSAAVVDSDLVQEMDKFTLVSLLP